MNRRLLLPLLLVVPGPACTKATPIDAPLAELCDEARYDDKRVRTDGYLFLGETTACGPGSCTLGIASGNKQLSVRVPTGEGVSKMDELTEGYSPATIKIRAADGTPLGKIVETSRKNGKPMIGINDQVRLTGEMWIMGDKVCQLKVDTIEKL